MNGEPNSPPYYVLLPRATPDTTDGEGANLFSGVKNCVGAKFLVRYLLNEKQQRCHSSTTSKRQTSRPCTVQSAESERRRMTIAHLEGFRSLHLSQRRRDGLRVALLLSPQRGRQLLPERGRPGFGIP